MPIPEAAPSHDEAAIIRTILESYALEPLGYHGVLHWARVLQNGLRVAEINGADREVVTLFALFHDARRVNEGRDHGHGQRGGDLARTLRGSLVHLDDAQFTLFYEACRLHTDGHTDADPTVQACWDADRLDLGRVGIKPAPHRLCTDAARSLLPWAHERAIICHPPIDVLKSWGLGKLVNVGNKREQKTQ
ncbi:MAG: hypothetical protein EBS01_14485 [Verrucomicrobia bacterium]|nr:hypothetical protein [Verrucomicrobiota bacterium]